MTGVGVCLRSLRNSSKASGQGPEGEGMGWGGKEVLLVSVRNVGSFRLWWDGAEVFWAEEWCDSTDIPSWSLWMRYGDLDCRETGRDRETGWGWCSNTPKDIGGLEVKRSGRLLTHAGRHKAGWCLGAGVAPGSRSLTGKAMAFFWDGKEMPITRGHENLGWAGGYNSLEI